MYRRYYILLSDISRYLIFTFRGGQWRAREVYARRQTRTYITPERAFPFAGARSTRIRGTRSRFCKKSMMIGYPRARASERASDGIQSTSIHTRRDANVIEKPRGALARSLEPRTNGFYRGLRNFYCRRLLIASEFRLIRKRARARASLNGAFGLLCSDPVARLSPDGT